MEDIKVGKISIPIIEGKQGAPGKEGAPGKPGDDGYSPVKGKDYFTPDEIEDVIGEVTTRAKENLEYEFRENIKDISYDNTTGIMTFTRYDGTTVDVDLPLELIVSSGTYNDTTKEIELTLANGQLIKIPLSDLIDDFYIKSEIDQKVNTINGELTNLKTEDSKLQETLTNQATKIEELEEQNKQLLKDYKPIPFNSSSNHIVDTGELPILDFGPEGGIEQDTRVGYNLLDTSNLQEMARDGVTIKPNKDGSFTINGTTTNSFGFNVALNNPQTLKANTTHTLKTIVEGTISSATNSVIGIRENESTNLGNTVNFAGTSKTYTPTVDVTVNYLRIYLDKDVTFTNFTVFPLLYEGTEDKVYEQFGAMPSLPFPSEVKGVSGHYDNVVENRNALSLEDYKDTSNLITSIDKQKIIATALVNDWEQTFFINNVRLKKGVTYTLRRTMKILSGTAFDITGQIELYKDSKWQKVIGSGNKNGYDTKNTFTVEETGTYKIRFKLTNANSGIATAFSVEFSNFMIYEGTEDTDYVEHQEQLLPIDIPFNMYSGKVYKENGKWYRPIEWGKEIFTGEENIVEDTGNYKIIKSLEINTSAYINRMAYCNYLKSYIWSNNLRDGIYFEVHPYSQTVYVKGTELKNTFPTVEDFKAWLQEQYANGTPMYVVFELLNPTIEEITDTTLIAQLEELQKANSYYEVTNINSYRATEDVAEMKLSGNALMSNDIRMSKLENAILSIGGNV